MRTPHIPRYADTVVIGGGTAGAAVAGLLAERGDQSVLLLEAGPDYGHLAEDRWPRELLDGRVLADSHDWSFTSAAAHGQPNHELQRAKVIGGCSAHNGCIAIWGSHADYDGWASAGNEGWTTAEVIPYFERAMTRLHVRAFAPEEVMPFHGACLEAMIATGIPRTANLNDLDEDAGAALAPVNIRHGMRWSTALAYLDPVRAQDTLTIAGDTLVYKVNLRGSRAVSVDVIHDEKRHTVEAGRIFLCGGAYGSPAVLLRSGIGPAGELAALDSPRAARTARRGAQSPRSSGRHHVSPRHTALRHLDGGLHSGRQDRIHRTEPGEGAQQPL